MMRITVAASSDRGAREINEDAVQFSTGDEIGCFVVADGAGGHGRGDVAARSVVRGMMEAFCARAGAERRVLDGGLSLARRYLEEARLSHPEASRMNSTIACLLLDTFARKALWLQLGDSRIYLFRNDRAHLLSHDHSVLQSTIDAGFRGGPVRGAPDRSRLYASVDCEDDVPNMRSETPVTIDDGDVFLICTDGFWDLVDEGEMEAALKNARNPRMWIDALFASLRGGDRGVEDNSSALAVWVGCKDDTTFLGHRGR